MDTFAGRHSSGIEELEITEAPSVSRIRDILNGYEDTAPGTPWFTPLSTPPVTEKPELFGVAECLIAIDQSPIHKRALEEVTKEATIKASRIEELTSRSDKLKTVIVQVVGFFLVFQGVMITVVAQSTVLRKDNLWSPMTLSVVAAVSCMIPVWQNGWAIVHIRGDMHHEAFALEVVTRQREELRRLGITYPFNSSGGQLPNAPSKYVYFIPYALILIFIICFTSLILVSQWVIRHSSSTLLVTSSP